MTPQLPDRNDSRAPTAKQSLRRRALAAVVAVLVAVPVALYLKPAETPSADRSATAPAVSQPAKPQAAKPSQGEKRFAQLGHESASADVRRMAHWVADSRDNGARAFVIIDKRDAKVFLFDPDAKLQTAVPALLGSARGDDTFPGVGDKPIAEVRDEEKTTPAGRFIAEVGESSSRGEDVVWVDYDAAVSMHRIIQKPERLQAMATPSVEDNRMSFGCINLPVDFYEKALRPAVDRTGVVVYVLPETRPLQQTFSAFYEVPGAIKLAQN